MIYVVSTWPSLPYEGGHYFNASEKTLGVYRSGSWDYYKPFTAKLPIDSYDLDFDGIPDEYDSEIPSDYSGSGPYTNPNGYIVPIDEYLSPVGKSLVNNSDITSSKTVDCDGMMVLADGSLHFFSDGDIIQFPPKASMFCGTMIDSDGDGIPDKYDTNAGYGGSGLFDGGPIDPSLLLSPLSGDGTKNSTTTKIKLSALEGGLMINPDGTTTFFKVGDLLDFDPGSVIFFGVFGDADGDGIPDGLDTDAGYTGSGDFGGCVGIDPSLFLSNVDSGSTNATPNSFSTTATSDGVIISNTCEVKVFKAGTQLSLEPGDTMFLGDPIDSDGDGIPNELDIDANYTGGDFTLDTNGDGTDDIITNINVSSLFNNHDTGSHNGSFGSYTVVANDDGVIITPTGSLILFKSGETITVNPGDTIFFGDIKDEDGDGIPDSLGTTVDFVKDPLVTGNGTPVTLGDIMSPPYSIVENTSNPPISITMGPFGFPVTLIGPNGEIVSIGPDTKFKLDPGWTLVKPEITSKELGKSFFTTTGSSAKVRNAENSSNGYKYKHFSLYDSETLQLNKVAVVDTVNFDDSFELDGSDSLTIKNS